MSAPPSPLPDLTPQDASRLDDLIAADLCPLTLAANTSTPVRELVLWADSPSIAPWLTRLRALRAAKLRQEMLAHLQSLVRTSPDPIESRRAATAVLKHLIPARPRERAAQASANNPTPHHPPAASQPPIPAPTLTPDPTLTPRDVADAILAAVRQPDPALAASTLAAFATPTATINSQPLVPAGHESPPRAILASAHKPLAQLATTKHTWFFAGPTFTPDPNTAEHPAAIGSAIPPLRTATYFQGITLPDKTAHRLALTLESRTDSTPPSAWRLTDLSLTPYLRGFS